MVSVALLFVRVSKVRFAPPSRSGRGELSETGVRHCRGAGSEEAKPSTARGSTLGRRATARPSSAASSMSASSMRSASSLAA